MHGSTLIAEAQRLLAEAERAAKVGTWIWSLATDEVVWSEQLYRILEYSPAEQAPSVSAFYARIHPDDLEFVVRASQSGRQKGDATEAVECRVKGPSGVVRHIRMQASEICGRDGATSAFVGSVIEITDRVALEKKLIESQRSEAIGILAAAISHDVSNGVQIALSAAELLLREQVLTPKQRGLVEIILKTSESTRQLTRQLLAIGRNAADSSRREAPLSELNAACRSLKPLLKAALGKTVLLSFSPAAEELPIALTVADLEQVLINLAVNARDAMPTGGTLSIELAAAALPESPNVTPRASRYALLRVKDSGVGIAPELLPRVFEPYFTTKEKRGGSGLGLASVQGIVKSIGGTIHATSLPARGTCFDIWLPLATHATVEADARRQARAGRAQIALVEPIKGISRLPRVAFVDDEHELVDLLSQILTELGCAFVKGFDSSRKAKEWLDVHAKEIDVLLTDVNMPSLSGTALAEAAALINPDLSCVLLTGGDVDHALQLAGIAEGRLVWLQKPFKSEDLRAVFESLCYQAGSASRRGYPTLKAE